MNAGVQAGPAHASGAFEVPGHLGSHRSLVPWARHRFVPGTVGPAVDLVAVPASRPVPAISHARPPGVAEAARVAARAGADLLVLASGQADPRRAHTAACEHLPAERVLVVTQKGRWHVPAAQLKADQLPMSRFRCSDTSSKRNTALAFARLYGKQRVLFLDDDVWGFGAAELETVRRALADGTGLDAVGWTFDQFPDNSMVCHAYRLAGGRQSTFIGGGALAVRANAPLPHFPLVYNEDWLFMLPLIFQDQAAVGRGGSLEQAAFDPFSMPADAQKQEFGDLLGEGFFRLRHLGEKLSRARDPEYWGEVLALRAHLIVEIRAALPGRSSGRRRDQVRRATEALDLAAALHRHQVAGRDGRPGPWPEALAEWVRVWEDDGALWSGYLGGLTPTDDLDRVLRKLALRRFDPLSRDDAATVPATSVAG